MSQAYVVSAADVPATCPPLHYGVEVREFFRQSGRLTFAVARMGVGGYAEVHAHSRSSHVIYLLEGRLEVTVGDARPAILEPGAAVLVPEGLPHATRTVGDTSCAYVIVTAPPAGGED